MHKSAKLHRARVVKNDEFYTQYDDVKKECDNYMPHFFNKIIYCNCDTDDSAFVKYFLDLKARGKIRDVIWSGGLGGLDFRSDAAVAILKRADIVVTNPPFSLFREFIDLLMENDKKFLAIGNHNAVKYKNIFTHIRNNRLWIGTRNFGAMFFDVLNPDNLIAAGKLGSGYKIIDNIPKAIVPATWFTNLKQSHREFLKLTKRYYGNESAYPRYDNFDAINVNDKRNIPYDYRGIIGVPITFLDRYNPNQFMILGLDREVIGDNRGAMVHGRRIYTRIFIKIKN